MVSESKARHSSWEREQKEQVLEAIPDWQDADSRAKDREAIVSLGEQYGFSEPEMTHTQDARTLRMLRDFAHLRRELEEAKAATKKQPGRPNAPGKSQPTISRSRKLAAALGRAKTDPTPQNRAAAVSQLLKATK